MSYLLPSVSNGNPSEQAMIRRWWHEQNQARGRLVWEYYLEGFYVDAIWFPDATGQEVEEPGKKTGRLFPLNGERIVLCEAKTTLNPELVGQALVYSEFARRAGATVLDTVVFAELALPQMKDVARALGLRVVVPAQAKEPDATAE